MTQNIKQHWKITQGMMTSKKEFVPLITLLIPLLINGVLHNLVWFFQTFLLAQLGRDVLAATALASRCFETVMVFFIGMLGAINILIAHQYGANNLPAIKLVIRDGLLLALLLVIPIFFIIWNMSYFFLLVGENPIISSLSESYLRAADWGIFPIVIIIVLFEMFIGFGHTQAVLVFSIIFMTLNIITSYGFIFGQFGLPKLGISGAGWAMTTSYWITSSLLVFYVIRHKNYSYFFRKLFSWKEICYFKELLYIGSAMAGIYCVECAFFFALTLAIGALSILSLAANQIALQYFGILRTMAYSIAQAITIRMSYFLGAHDKERAKDVAYMGVLIAFIFSLIAAILYLFFSDALISIDLNTNESGHGELAILAKKFLMISAIFQFVEFIRISLFGALRALKDTSFPLLLAIVTLCMFVFPFGNLFSSFFSPQGSSFWWGMILGNSCGVIFLFLRFKKTYQNLS